MKKRCDHDWEPRIKFIDTTQNEKYIYGEAYFAFMCCKKCKEEWIKDFVIDKSVVCDELESALT